MFRLRSAPSAVALCLLAGCYGEDVPEPPGADAGGDADADADLSSWTREVVDQALPNCDCISAAVDAAGVPHLVYGWSADPEDVGPNEWRHAVRENGQWSIETISPIPNTRVETVLAIDSTGAAQAAAIWPGAFGDRYTLRRWVRGSHAWESEVIDGPGRMGDLAMVLDADGAMHVAYTVGEETPSWVYMRLRYATNASGEWRVEDVAPSDEAFSLAIALDAAGGPRIAYLQGRQSDEARLAQREEAAWASERAAEVTWDPLMPSSARATIWNGPMGLIVDGAGTDHLFVPGGALVHADDAGGAWATDPIPPQGTGNGYSIVALQDPTGRFHTASVEVGPIVQERFMAFGIGYASGTSGAWTSETVDSWEVVQTDVGLAMGPDETLHIAYVDGDARVIYARRPAP